MDRGVVPNGPLQVDACEASGWRSLPRLTWLLVGEDHGKAIEAAEAAAELLDDMLPEKAIQLDERIRASFRLGYVGPEVLHRLPLHGDTRWAVYGLMSSAPNGHVREAATRELAEVNSGRELPFLLVRVNDWVGPVRAVAVEAISRRFTSGYAEHFVRVLPLVYRLAEFRRIDHAARVRYIEAFLLIEGRDALLAAVHSKQPSLRRACVQCLAGVSDDGAFSVLASAMEDPDPVVANRAAGYVLPRMDNEQLAVLVQRLDSIRNVRLRVQLLEASVARGIEGVSAVLYKSLFDPNSAVRETARFYLRGDPQVTSGEVYIRALPELTGKPLLGAIEGISDNNRPEYADVVLPFTAPGNRSRVRQSALSVFARLSKTPSVVLFRALSDQQPGVSKVAMHLLVKHHVFVSDVEIAELLSNPESHVRKHALALLLRQGKWTSLRWALAALEDPQCADVELVATFVQSYEANFNSSFARPKGNEIAAILDSLSRVAEQLPTRTVEFIRFVARRETV